MYPFNQLEKITNGTIIQPNNHSFSLLSIDSRNNSSPAPTLFFAIKGDRNNGHNHINELYEKGVRQFVVEESIDYNLYPKASFFLCQSSITTLQHLAAFHRNKFDLELLAITGSNGKTIVKEWLFQLLSNDFNIVKSPKSYNSQLGVALSVWQINETNNLGIFEAGISTVGEMHHLKKMLNPKFGIFTNIGTAHSKGFASESEKINEKLKLFDSCEMLIYCKDHKSIDEAIVNNLSVNTFTWGKNSASDLIIKESQKNRNHSSIKVIYKNEDRVIELPFTDNSSIENAMHCVSYLLLKAYDFDSVNQKLSELRFIKMRLELKKGINDCQIIDDTYNNDIGGIQVALAFMEQQNTDLEKTAIISDILQSGLEEPKLYGKLNNLLQEHKISKLIGIGEAISKNKNQFTIPIKCYSTTEDFILKLPEAHFEKELILVKGARIHQFEKIVHQLTHKIHGTVLEINLNAITRNLNYYQSKLRPNTKIMVMVKAFAYGSGSNEVANLLQHHKVDYLGVAYTDEGVELRKNGIHLPIMVMNPSIESFDKISAFNLEPEIYSFGILEELLSFAKNLPIGIHIKLDTGMRRLGFESNDIGRLINILKTNPNIKIKSIFTHLAGADEATHNEFSMQQFELFKMNANQIKQALNVNPLLHALNSAGIIRFPDHHFDMVRLGIGLYGVDSNKTGQNDLEPISTLKTVISQVKHISKGETIGYGRTGVAITDMKIATIAIGYADGFNRKFGNGVGFVKVNGAKAPTIGNICMDMTMIDVTNLEINEDDEVEVFGKDISITEMANSIDTIPYEILTSVSNRVKRIFYLD